MPTILTIIHMCTLFSAIFDWSFEWGCELPIYTVSQCHDAESRQIRDETESNTTKTRCHEATVPRCHDAKRDDADCQCSRHMHGLTISPCMMRVDSIQTVNAWRRRCRYDIQRDDADSMPRVPGCNYTRVSGSGFNFWVSKEKWQCDNTYTPNYRTFFTNHVFLFVMLFKMNDQMWIRAWTKIVTIVTTNKNREKS